MIRQLVVDILFLINLKKKIYKLSNAYYKKKYIYISILILTSSFHSRV